MATPSLSFSRLALLVHQYTQYSRPALLCNLPFLLRRLPRHFLIRSYAHFLALSQIEPRRAAVSLILRIRPPEGYPVTADYDPPPLAEFFQQDWVRHPRARAELLFIRREKQKLREREVRGAGTSGAYSSAPAHVAFPGGRTEESDEGALYTGV